LIATVQQAALVDCPCGLGHRSVGATERRIVAVGDRGSLYGNMGLNGIYVNQGSQRILGGRGFVAKGTNNKTAWPPVHEPVRYFVLAQHRRCEASTRREEIISQFGVGHTNAVAAAAATLNVSNSNDDNTLQHQKIIKLHHKATAKRHIGLMRRTIITRMWNTCVVGD
jgi:hypothetical protein